MRIQFRAAYFTVAMAFMFGCASEQRIETPVAAPAEAETGRKIAMEARVQLQDKVEQKTYTLVLEALAVEPSRMRLDLTGPFGSPMGKLVLRGNLVGILVPQQKKAFFGAATENSFKPLMPLAISPQKLMRLLWGEVPKDWTCESKGVDLETCTDPEKKLNFEHDPRPEGKQAKWSVTGEKFAMTLLPISIKTNVLVKTDAFALPIPNGYSKHKLP